MQGRGRRAGLSLEDMLRHIDLKAAEQLVKALQKDASLSPARLTCRALRDFIDAGLRSVVITVRPGDLESRQMGAASMLSRWPLLTSVSVELDTEGPSDDPVQLGNLLVLPFMGLSPEARKRITCLNVHIVEEGDADIPGFAIADVLRRLPGLQQLRLDGVPEQPFEQELFYNALEAHDLQALKLPCGRTLENVHLLAGSLRRLDMLASDGAQLDAAMVASIQCLSRLEQLTLEPEDNVEEVRLLLRDMQPSVRVLELRKCHLLNPDGHCNAVLSLSSGHVTELKVGGSSTTVKALATFVEEVLLPSGAEAPQGMALVSLEEVRFDRSSGSLLGDPSTESPLKALLQRCQRVEVHRMCVADGVPARVLFGAFQWLHAPREMYLMAKDGSQVAKLRLWSADQVPAASPLSLSANAATPQPPQLPPQAPRLADLALERLQAEGLPQPGVPEASAAAAEGASAAVTGSTAVAPSAASAAPGSAAKERRSGRLLLLRGTPLGRMTSDGSEQGLRPWLQQVSTLLEAKDKREDSGSPFNFSFAHLHRRAFYVLALPASDAVLLQSETPDLLAASARESWKELVGVASGAAASDGSASLRLWLLKAAPGVDGMCEAVGKVFHKVMVDARDGQGFSAGWSEQQRLRWMLEQWEHRPYQYLRIGYGM